MSNCNGWRTGPPLSSYGQAQKPAGTRRKHVKKFSSHVLLMKIILDKQMELGATVLDREVVIGKM